MASGAGIIILLTLVIYLPSLFAGFIWDDDVMLTGNPLIKASGGLYDIWFSTALPDYFPLTSTTFWLEWRLWGMHAVGYHLTNVLLHTVNAVLLWRVLARLKIPGARPVAVVWVIHPVCVASVAWIAERKNTLSLFFFLLGLLWYLWFDIRESAASAQSPQAGDSQPPAPIKADPVSKPRRKWYWLSLAAFLLALLSKTSVVILPLVLLLCSWWLHGKISRRDLWRNAPFFVLSLILGLMTVWFQTYRGLGEGMVSSPDNRLVRLLGGSWAVWHYLFKALVPLNLMMIYPRWEIDPRSFWAYSPGLALLGLAGLFWRYRKTWGRSFLFAFAYSVVALAPVLGFFDMGFLAYSRVADHWQYLSLIGIVALVVGGATHWLQTRLKLAREWRSRLSGSWITIVVVSLCVLTWRHQKDFANSESLWRDTLARNSKAWVAHNSLGLILVDQGRITEGVSEYRQALKLNSHDPNAHYNLANALAQQGKSDEAVSHYKKSLWLNPNNIGPHHNLAIVLNLQSKYAEAAAHCFEALKMNPYDANVEDTLGNALAGQGKLQEAEQHYSAALAIDPNHFNAHKDVGILLARHGDYTNAVVQFMAAVQIRPGDAGAHLDLGKALSLLGQLDPAADHYTTALRLQPEMAEAHYNWALLFLKKRQPIEAIVHYREALRLRPDYVDALNNLAWFLATSPDARLRDGIEAVRMAEKACELSARKEARFLGTLDAAYAEAGRFPEALTMAKKARELALAAGQQDLAEAALLRLEGYETGRAWRETLP